MSATYIPMKEWRYSEAKRLHVSESCIAMRIARGYYPDLKVERVNSRTVFVRIEVAQRDFASIMP